MKLAWIQFYPLDWLRDTGCLSAEARGIWIDILMFAWNEPERGVYSRDRESFCNQLRIKPERLIDLLYELTNVAMVTASNEKVTVICRRMQKEAKRYKDNANRQAKFKAKRKGNEKVTRKTLDVRLQTTSERLTSSPSVGFPSSFPLASPSPAPSPSFRAKAPAPAPLATTEPKSASETSTPALTKTEVYLPWELPESERLTPEEMADIRKRYLGERPKH